MFFLRLVNLILKPTLKWLLTIFLHDIFYNCRFNLANGQKVDICLMHQSCYRICDLKMRCSNSQRKTVNAPLFGHNEYTKLLYTRGIACAWYCVLEMSAVRKAQPMSMIEILQREAYI